MVDEMKLTSVMAGAAALALLDNDRSPLSVRVGIKHAKATAERQAEIAEMKHMIEASGLSPEEFALQYFHIW